MALLDATMHAHAVLWAIERAGQDAAGAARRVGFDPADHAEPLGSVPYETVARLLDEAERLLRSPALGLEMGEHAPPQAFGLLGYYYLSHPDARVVIEGAYDLLRRSSNVFAVELCFNGSGSRLALTPARPDLPHLSTMADFHASVFTWNTRKFVYPEFAPTRVLLPHAPQAPQAAYARLFCCPVVFEAPRLELHFDAALLQRSNSMADLDLHRALRPYAQQVLAALPGNGALVGRVRAAIALELTRRPPALASVAQRLGYRPRTLQHQLRSAGTTFQQVLDQVRREASADLLADPGLTLDNIGYRLGYGSAAAFNRAYRRWTGVAPSAHRPCSGP